MPFIPYNPAAYRSGNASTTTHNNSNLDQQGTSSQQQTELQQQQQHRSHSEEPGSADGSRNGSPRANSTGGFGVLRRRKSVSNTLFNFVNSMRPNGGVAGSDSPSPFTGGLHNGSGTSLASNIFKSRSRAGSTRSNPQSQMQGSIAGQSQSQSQGQGSTPQHGRSRSTSINSRTPATTPTPMVSTRDNNTNSNSNGNGNGNNPDSRATDGYLDSANPFASANGYTTGDPNSSYRRGDSAGLNGEMSISVRGNVNDTARIGDDDDDLIITGMGISSTDMRERAPLSTIFSNSSNSIANDNDDLVVVDAHTSTNNATTAEPPYIHMNLNEIPGNGSVVITGQANGSHNRYDPEGYSYNLANSATIGNFREYVGGIIENRDENDIRGGPHTVIEIDDEDFADAEEPMMPPSRSAGSGSGSGSGLNTNRTRANTLRDDLMVGGVAMNAENNNTVGTQTEADEDIEMGGENENENDGNDDVAVTHSYNHISKADKKGFFSIRLTPSIDHNSTHPYMFFGPIVRKMKPGMSISLGRYTEKNKKAAIAAAGSSEPVVFKSKVVSRKHAELSVTEDGEWFLQDVKSSSGTFVNHVRLAPPGILSEKSALHDGDIIQLGVDYRGGSEELYRCVKVKVELNRSWKRGRAGQFSKTAHEKLRAVTGMDASACVICLDNIRAGQPVFVASCGHGWHYRCIRPLLVKTYPQFLCPCCKSVCDLENSDGGSSSESETEN